MPKAYLSEISPWWTIERQETVLASAVPGWPKGVIVFRDLLDVKDRRSHQPDRLTERRGMLRGTSRKADTLYVATLAVLAWTEDDLRTVLADIEARGWTLISVDDGTVLDAVATWKVARRKSRLEGAAKRGGAVSAVVRGQRAQAGAMAIKDRWGLPSDEKMRAKWGMPWLEVWPTAVLLDEAGISRNAANHYIGITRERAQERFQRAEKARVTRAARAAKES